MAKISVIHRNIKRKRMAANQAKARAALKQQRLDPSLSDEERDLAELKLQKLPKNGSAVRVVSRCSMTGRGRGVYRKFGLSRIKFRELALEGRIPGVTKASW
ncbi:30S ribosomal protein S14 [bacterium]|nr:30S ribosomal protein S14 [bacterium]